MKVKIIDTTNKEIKKYIGETRNYFEMYGCACLEELDNPFYGIKTSSIESKKEDDKYINIKTKNSNYVLEKVEENNDKD